ncbi:MAG TPA: GNAT family N-acetyltransferase [Pyrinomonadaceae bacterium]|nr:GNAT family N-acetyltransferase [Pyrinomonadaceae bacterium]
MTIEFREVEPGDYNGLRQFLSEQGWADRVRDVDRFRTMLERSHLTVLALDGDEIVGFARALCDGASNGYISMVAVSPDRRRQGIGRELVTRLMSGDTEGRITWVLRARPDNMGFWTRLGFSLSSIAMERVRSQ